MCAFIFLFGLLCNMSDGRYPDLKTEPVPIDVGRIILETAESCGQSNSSPTNETTNKITGGSPTLPNEFPWMVLIEAAFKTSYQCSPTSGISFRLSLDTTGVLISDQWVLTSAFGLYFHGVSSWSQPCGWMWGGSNFTEVFYSPAANEAVAIFGVHNSSLKYEPQRLAVKSHQIFYHPNYKNSSNISNDLPYDLALIRLPEPVPLSRNIRPICLPGLNDPEKDIVGDLVTMMGWGLRENGTFKLESSVPILQSILPRYGETVGVLHDTQVTGQPNAECQNVFPGYNLTDNGIACVSGQGFATGGDGGGAIASSENGQSNWKLVAITSPMNDQRRRPSEGPDKFSVGIKVQAHLEWIYSLLNDPTITTPPPRQPTMLYSTVSSTPPTVNTTTSSPTNVSPTDNTSPTKSGGVLNLGMELLSASLVILLGIMMSFTCLCQNGIVI